MFEGSKGGVRRMSPSNPAVWANFEATLGLLLVSEGGFGSLWDHCGVTLGIRRSVFEKHSFSQIDLNDFIQL